jgi:hypothetical protein
VSIRYVTFIDFVLGELVNKIIHACLVALLACTSAAADEPTMQEISLDDLRDKIRGGWAGQMIGVSYGAPTEFQYLEGIVPESELPVWQPDMIREALNQDDLYVDITFASVLDQYGLDATTDDFGAMFRDSEYALWHANLAARRALRRGVPATLSGTPRYNMHANDIDFQIEADFIGLMSPGLPQASNDLSFRAGRVMNHGDGILGGMFVGAMYAAAFFENDTTEIVRAGLAALPATSEYAKVIADVLLWHAQSPEDWMVVWQRIDDKWNGREACPAGAMQAFNIDAKLNGAYVALGLLYGEGDFDKTLAVATRAGQDSDCNPSSALGILGVVMGFDGIPSEYSSGIEAIAEEHFSYTDYSFNDIVDSTTTRALKLIERTGGKVTDDTAYVKTQAPMAAEVEPWDDYGEPTELVPFDDERWQWAGDWQIVTKTIWKYERTSRISSQRGAEASIRFTGTGAGLIGILLPTGGTADVYLDGTLSDTIDVYPDEPMAKTNESLWHRFGLEDEEHELRIVVRGEKYGASEGSDISITRLTVFR